MVPTLGYLEPQGTAWLQHGTVVASAVKVPETWSDPQEAACSLEEAAAQLKLARAAKRRQSGMLGDTVDDVNPALP